MTYPRSHLVDPDGGAYHVYSRCVRRAYLCGTDPVSGNNYDHRRQWLEDRMLALAEIFAIDVFGYAVMSNHYHIVLKVNPAEVKEWTDDSVIERWLMLNPRKNDNEDKLKLRRQEILEDPARLKELRHRLGSLSWFMRYLNEPLARLANREDGCKGRFWEGRFQSQRLLDDHALLGTMVYVDLNPVRAGITGDATKAAHTSLSRRVKEQIDRTKVMTAMGRSISALPYSYSLQAYIELTEWTLAIQRSKKPARISGVPPSDIWLRQYLPKPGSWQRALGSIQSIKSYAQDLGLCWIRTGSGHSIT